MPSICPQHMTAAAQHAQVVLGVAAAFAAHDMIDVGLVEW
jgi:hypothetical protein